MDHRQRFQYPDFKESIAAACGPERHPLSDLYSSLEEMAGIGTWRYAFQTRHLSWSSGIYSLLGIDAASAKPCHDLFARMTHPDDRVPIDDLGPYLREMRLIDRDFRIVRPNGSIRWLAHKAEVFVNKAGEPFMAVGLLLDITARGEAIRARDAAEARLRAMAQGTHCFTWVTRADGFKAPCQGWMDLTGQTAAESSGCGWLDCVHASDRDRIKRAWQHAVDTQTVYAAKYRVACRDGVIRWIIARAFPVLDEAGALKEWYGVAMDVSDVKAPDDPLVGIAHHGHPTGQLVKTARALLDWSINDLSRASGVSVSSVRRFEAGTGVAAQGSAAGRLAGALTAAGIEFRHIDDGELFVRLRQKQRT